MIKFGIMVLAVAILLVSVVYAERRFRTQNPGVEEEGIDERMNPIRMLHGHFRDNSIWKQIVGDKGRESGPPPPMALASGVRSEPEIIRKLLRILRYSKPSPGAANTVEDDDNGVVTYFQPPNKRQIVYRQCFFNPISCF